MEMITAKPIGGADMNHFDLSTLARDAKGFVGNVKSYREDVLEKAEDMLNRIRIQEYLEKKKKDEDVKKAIMMILAVVGTIACVAAIVYAVELLFFTDEEEYDDAEDEDEADEETIGI